MGIIDKLTGHSSSDTHGKHSDQTTAAPSFGQDSTFTESNTQSSTQAPIVQERTHDQYNNINNTDRTAIHDRTEVQQTTQPIYDQRTEGVQRDRVDHGTEIREHGHGGIDKRTEQELSHNRDQLAREYQSTHDQSTTTTDGGRSHDTQNRTNTVEEVVPVIQQDVYRPHETEHNKMVVDVHHEQPKLGTHTNDPMSLQDWKKDGAHSHTQHHTRKERMGSSSSSSSDEEGAKDGSTGTGTTRRKKGLGEKIKEKLGLDPKTNDPKDQGYSNTGTTGTTGHDPSSTTGTTGYGTSSTTGTTGPSTTSTGSTAYAEDPTANGEGYSNKQGESGTTNLLTGHHHGTGMGEKIKDTVTGGNHHNAAGTGYNQSGTTGAVTGTTGYGNTNTTGTGYNQSGTSQYDGDRKMGMGEKIKETVSGGNHHNTGTGYTDSSQYGNTSGSDYNQSGTTASTTGYGNHNTTGTGYADSSSQYGNTSGYNQSGDRNVGIGEKIKDAVSGNNNNTGYNQSGTTGTTGYGGSNNTTGTGYNQSGDRNVGMGEKIKDAVSGNNKNTGYNQSGTTGYGGSDSNTTGTGYNQSGDRNIGMGEKIKDAVSGNNNNTGYNQSSTTGYGGSNSNTTGTGYTDSSQYGGNTDTNNQYSDASTTDIHRKKGLGEKVKEKLGM